MDRFACSCLIEHQKLYLVSQFINWCWTGFIVILFLEPVSSQIGSLIWWRNHVVAPVSEEFTFRACMMPALLQCFRPISAVFICPLFFGIGEKYNWKKIIYTFFFTYNFFLYISQRISITSSSGYVTGWITKPYYSSHVSQISQTSQKYNG